jgi:NAD(P)-dependent dehydrogenase (short-subunit alcohol dehydrogenase family)
MKNKVVVITGAGSGIGKACAIAFAEADYSVVLNGRRQDAIEAVADVLHEKKRAALAVKGDVSREEDCRDLVNATIKHFGRIDVLINNAGISMRALFENTDLAVLHKLMDVNFWGTVYCTKFALPHLLKSKGSVVGVSSIAGKKGLPGRIGYSASKFAMEGFLESLRTENLKKDLHVLVACPGFTATDIRNTALSADGRQQGESPRDEQSMMTADEVADRIFRAVKSRKRDLILTANGNLTVWLDKFFPGLMDKLVFKHMSREPGSPF